MPPSSRPTKALALALALAACDPARPPAPSPAPAPAPVAVTPPAPPPGSGAQVFVDVSESIRGFTSTRGTALQTLHAQVIEASLSALQLNNPFQRCAVDTAVHCEAPQLTPQQARLPATYRGAYSALHLALRRPPRAPRPDLQQPDPLDPYNVTVLVTDGFQSTSTPFQPGASGDVACTAGADPSCLAALLRQRVEEGYGLWVGRLILPFDGRYFAERRLDPAMWSRVTQHVAALNTDPQWNGVRFAASSPSMTGESGAFRWQGARPLLVFVLTRDIPRGRQLVGEMQRRLAVERITLRQSAGDIDFSEWSPFEGLTARVLNAVRNESGGAADSVIVDRPVRQGETFVIPARCDVRGQARIRLDGVIQFGAMPPPPIATVSLTWQSPTPLDGFFLMPREPMRTLPGPFTVRTGIDCRQLPPGTRDYNFGLFGRWTVNPAALASAWFTTGSAETSYDSPEKVFGLADLARTVIAAGVNRQGYLDRVTLRVTRQ
ncbi:MAG: hypothetical protein Q8S73_16325 [Deltaproteobacteria bacterium]|nr:hypothetical protein [Myxococcales bacterium]MDP3215675.1 hypothetical protein [Deltaproteobacteria bacterium]